MQSFIHLTIVALTLFAAVTAAWAVNWEQDPTFPPTNGEANQLRTDVFDRLDSNGDGVLTAADGTTDGRAKFFAQLRQAADGNGDGRVTREEYAAVQRISLMEEPVATEQNPTAAAFMLTLDIDRDGGLSSAEISIAADRLLTLDANGDGDISPEELNTAGQIAVEILANENRADREIAALFAQFDKDHDGQIGPGEAPERMRRVFEQLDIDANGTISLEEFSHALHHARREFDSAGEGDSNGLLPGTLQSLLGGLSQD